MAGSYIPARDAALNDWLENFRDKVALYAEPVQTPPAGPLFLSTMDVQTVHRAVQDWITAYSAAKNKQGRTSVQVGKKDLQKKESIAAIRAVVRKISGIVGLDPNIRKDLQLNPLNSGRTPRLAPVEPPAVVIKSMTNMAVEVAYDNRFEAGTRKAKPTGVIACQFRVTIPDLASVDPDAGVVIANATKTPHKITFDPRAAGRRGVIVARWVTRRGESAAPGELGDGWGERVEFTIPAIGPAAANV